MTNATVIRLCCVGRPVREAGAADERETDQEEEVNDQEMHTEPVLQRVVLVRSGVRTDPGTIRYDTRCYFYVRSKADMSQLNLPHGTDN